MGNIKVTKNLKNLKICTVQSWRSGIKSKSCGKACYQLQKGGICYFFFFCNFFLETESRDRIRSGVVFFLIKINKLLNIVARLEGQEVGTFCFLLTYFSFILVLTECGSQSELVLHFFNIFFGFFLLLYNISFYFEQCVAGCWFQAWIRLPTSLDLINKK